jgi:hypothetical protein
VTAGVAPSSTWNTGKRRSRPVADRIEEKVDRTGGVEACWKWLGAVDQGGRAQIWWNGRVHPVSRVVLALEMGQELAPDTFACHRCDNPLCVNPRHLFAGTASDNQRDAVTKGRHRGNAERKRLSADEQRELVSAYGSGLSTYETAKRFGVSRRQVRRHLRLAGVTPRKTTGRKR